MSEVLRYIATGFMFALGAILGSFANVVIYRLPRGLSITNPVRSFCPACGCTIPWHDNIPILSYIALRAKCRFCHAPISVRYVVVEFLCGLTFAAAAFLKLPDIAATARLAVLGFLCVTGAFTAAQAAVPWKLWLCGVFLGVALCVAQPSMNEGFFRWLPLPNEPVLVMERVRSTVGGGLLAGGVGGAALLARLITVKAGWAKPRGSAGGGAMLAPFLRPDTMAVLFGGSLAVAALLSLLLSLILRRRLKVPYLTLLAPACWFCAAFGWLRLV